MARSGGLAMDPRFPSLRSRNPTDDMKDFGILALVAIAMAAFAGGAIFYSRWLEKQRREAFQKAAEALGLSFTVEGSAGMLQRLARFKLFNRGHGKKIQNVIQGDAGDVAISVFDYRFTTGSGKNKNTQHQSVISLASPQLNCPELRIRPEHFFDRFGSALGLQDIDYPSHPQFSKMFVLQGTDEEQVRAFLNEPLLEWLESKPGICLEAVGETLFFYRSRKRIKPEQIKDALAEAYEIFGLLVDAS